MWLRNQGEVINLLYLKHQVQIFKLLPRALQARIFELLLRALQARIFKLLLRALQARIFEQLLAALRARIFALQMVLRVVMLLRGLEMPGEGAELLGLGNCLSHSWAKSTIVTQNVKGLRNAREVYRCTQCQTCGSEEDHLEIPLHGFGLDMPLHADRQHARSFQLHGGEESEIKRYDPCIICVCAS